MSLFTDKGILQFFDGGFPSSSLSLLTGTNVYNLGGYTAGSARNNDIEAVSYNCVWVGQLLNAVARLSDYRNYDLVKTILNLYSDAIKSTINFKADKLIDVEGDDQLTEELNKDLKDMGYLDYLNSILDDFIYYTSYSYGISYENKKFIVKDLRHPFTSLFYKRDKKYIVFSDDGTPEFHNNLLRFANDDLNLMLDDKILTDLHLYEDRDIKNLRADKKSIYALPGVLGNEPMFLACELRLKDYILKDTISSYLSLMDMIQQDTFTIDADRISDTVNLLKLCERIKGLLVTKDDMNLLASARLDRTALIRRLFDRVRVIPSVAGNLNSMTKLEGTNLQDKLNTLQTQKETVREDLLNTIGFPLDLFRGQTTKWEAGRQNDRYNIRVTGFKNALVNSTEKNVRTMAKMKEIDLSKKKIKVLFIEETTYEIQNKVNKINAYREKLQAVQDMIRTGSDLAQTEGIANPDEMMKEINSIFKDCGIVTELKVNRPDSEGSQGAPRETEI